MGLLTRVWAFLFLHVLIIVFSIRYVFFFTLAIFTGRNKQTSTRDKSTEPKCLSDPQYGVHGTLTLKEYHNFNIHYVANGSKDKPLMLFLHGFPEFWYVWKYQLPEFGKDYYAVAIDLLGYGTSSKPKELGFYSSKELATSVKEVIKELGYTSCVLVAHDWGGAISYVVSNEYSEVVDKLIIMNCPHGRALRKAWENDKRQLLASGYMFFFQLPWLPEYFLSYNDSAFLNILQSDCKKSSQMPDEELDAYKYIFEKGGFTAPLNYYRMAMSTSNPRVKWKTIDIPSCIIWGTEDKALRVELAAASADEFSNCQLSYIDGASHWVNIDEPEKCNQVMRDFLK